MGGGVKTLVWLGGEDICLFLSAGHHGLIRRILLHPPLVFSGYCTWHDSRTEGSTVMQRAPRASPTPRNCYSANISSERYELDCAVSFSQFIRLCHLGFMSNMPQIQTHKLASLLCQIWFYRISIQFRERVVSQSVQHGSSLTHNPLGSLFNWRG